MFKSTDTSENTSHTSFFQPKLKQSETYMDNYNKEIEGRNKIYHEIYKTRKKIIYKE